MKVFKSFSLYFCFCCLAIAVLFSSLLRAHSTADTKDSQSLRERFATDSTAADFIFVVNTSSVLSNVGVFAELRTQLPQVLEVLSPIDNFVLIGFDKQARTLVSACPAGDNTLPHQSTIFRMRDPRGPSGSLREGLGAAMNALNRPNHGPLQFLFLILDADIAAQSRGGSSADSSSWEALAKLYADRQDGSIAEVYGLVVGDPSELQITRMIFPEIRFVETSVVSLRGFFERWRSELPSRKLRLQLSHEIGNEVVVVQSVGEVKFTDREATAEARIRVRSRLRKLSMALPYLGDWSVFPDWLKLAPRYEDFPLTLAPGESRDLLITISRESPGSFFGCWHWQKRDKTNALISYAPAISLDDHATIRSLGVEEPSLFMHKLTVEIIQQHGQPAWLLWLVIGTVSLMTMSLVISRRYGLPGNDFAVAFLKTHFTKVRASLSRYLPDKFAVSESFKNDLMWLFSIPFISSMTFVIATVCSLWVAERWLGKAGLGAIAIWLFAFWSMVVKQQVGMFWQSRTALGTPLPSRQQKVHVPSMMNPSLDAVAEE